MALRVHCPVCGYHIKAPDGSFGRRGQCPKCKLMIRMPTEAEFAARDPQAAAGSGQARDAGLAGARDPKSDEVVRWGGDDPEPTLGFGETP